MRLLALCEACLDASEQTPKPVDPREFSKMCANCGTLADIRFIIQVDTYLGVPKIPDNRRVPDTDWYGKRPEEIPV